MFPSAVDSRVFWGAFVGFMRGMYFFSVLYFSNRTVALKHVLYLSACQQRLGQAHDPLTPHC